MFVGFMLVSNSMSIMPFRWGNAYYGVLIATFIFLFFEKTGKINAPMFLLYIFSALSIAANDVPDFFRAWPRLGSFFLMTALISPAFMTEKAIQFKTQMFSTVALLLMMVTIISVFIYITGGGYNAHNILDRYFRGATKHSMLMGPVAAISNLYCLFQLQYKQTRWMKYLYYAIIGGGMLCIMQAGSRAALISSVMSMIAFMYFRYKEQFIVVVRKYIVYITLIVCSAPLWMIYMNNIQTKNKGDTSLNTDSRSVYWKQRIVEWESSPIWGIGFSTVDAEAEYSTVNKQSGTVETGSSWLCILSMTGILGFSCVIIIFIGAIRKGLQVINSSPATGSFLLSYLVFFIFHMMAEGYIFAGGSFMSAQIWLLLGTIYSIAYMPEYGEILEDKLKFKFTKIKIPGIKFGE